jgi:hypothetical protein
MDLDQIAARVAEREQAIRRAASLEDLQSLLSETEALVSSLHAARDGVQRELAEVECHRQWVERAAAVRTPATTLSGALDITG